jgi:hypothetical protein
MIDRFVIVSVFVTENNVPVSPDESIVPIVFRMRSSISG